MEQQASEAGRLVGDMREASRVTETSKLSELEAELEAARNALVLEVEGRRETVQLLQTLQRCAADGVTAEAVRVEKLHHVMCTVSRQSGSSAVQQQLLALDGLVSKLQEQRGSMNAMSLWDEIAQMTDTVLDMLVDDSAHLPLNKLNEAPSAGSAEDGSSTSALSQLRMLAIIATKDQRISDLEAVQHEANQAQHEANQAVAAVCLAAASLTQTSQPSSGVTQSLLELDTAKDESNQAIDAMFLAAASLAPAPQQESNTALLQVELEAAKHRIAELEAAQTTKLSELEAAKQRMAELEAARDEFTLKFKARTEASQVSNQLPQKPLLTSRHMEGEARLGEKLQAAEKALARAVAQIAQQQEHATAKAAAVLEAHRQEAEGKLEEQQQEALKALKAMKIAAEERQQEYDIAGATWQAKVAAAETAAAEASAALESQRKHVAAGESDAMSTKCSLQAQVELEAAKQRIGELEAARNALVLEVEGRRETVQLLQTLQRCAADGVTAEAVRVEKLHHVMCTVSRLSGSSAVQQQLLALDGLVSKLQEQRGSMNAMSLWDEIALMTDTVLDMLVDDSAHLPLNNGHTLSIEAIAAADEQAAAWERDAEKQSMAWESERNNLEKAHAQALQQAVGQARDEVEEACKANAGEIIKTLERAHLTAVKHAVEAAQRQAVDPSAQVRQMVESLQVTQMSEKIESLQSALTATHAASDKMSSEWQNEQISFVAAQRDWEQERKLLEAKEKAAREAAMRERASKLVAQESVQTVPAEPVIPVPASRAAEPVAKVPVRAPRACEIDGNGSFDLTVFKISRGGTTTEIISVSELHHCS